MQTSDSMLMSCANSGPVGSALASALHFFAASQCLLQEAWPRGDPVYSKLLLKYLKKSTKSTSSYRTNCIGQAQFGTSW